jgi:hypothetical protein
MADDAPTAAEGTGRRDALSAAFSDVTARGSCDYLLRTLQQNQLQLVVLADQKAGIVLTVSLLMVTFTVSKIGVGVANPAMMVLLGGALMSAVLAVISLVPNLSNSKPPPSGDGDDPLFFGRIGAVDLNTYSRALAATLQSDAKLYGAISADVHAVACLLRRKYAWLRSSYLALLVTLIASVGTLAALHLG